MAEDVLNEIDSKVKDNKVMLFMKGTPDFPQCGFSAHTVEILKILRGAVCYGRCLGRCRRA